MIYQFISIPFAEDSRELLSVWSSAFDTVLDKGNVALSDMRLTSYVGDMSLQDAEGVYKEYDLAYAILSKFGNCNDMNAVLQIKQEISKHIADKLKASKLEPRRCKYCGAKLPWNYPYGMCENSYYTRVDYAYF